MAGRVLCFLSFSTLPGLVAGDRAQRRGAEQPVATGPASGQCQHTVCCLSPGWDGRLATERWGKGLLALCFLMLSPTTCWRCSKRLLRDVPDLHPLHPRMERGCPALGQGLLSLVLCRDQVGMGESSRNQPEHTRLSFCGVW